MTSCEDNLPVVLIMLFGVAAVVVVVGAVRVFGEPLPGRPGLALETPNVVMTTPVVGGCFTGTTTLLQEHTQTHTNTHV